MVVVVVVVVILIIGLCTAPECIEKGFHYWANSLTEVKTPSADACACSCMDHQGCRFFTWSAKDEICRLKYSDRGRTKTSEDFYSGSKDCCIKGD